MLSEKLLHYSSKLKPLVKYYNFYHARSFRLMKVLYRENVKKQALKNKLMDKLHHITAQSQVLQYNGYNSYNAV